MAARSSGSHSRVTACKPHTALGTTVVMQAPASIYRGRIESGEGWEGRGLEGEGCVSYTFWDQR